MILAVTPERNVNMRQSRICYLLSTSSRCVYLETRKDSAGNCVILVKRHLELVHAVGAHWRSAGKW
jgi:hypothetical protein